MTDSHHSELRAVLNTVRRRWMATVCLRASARVGVSVGLIVLAAVVADRLWLPGDLPLVLLAMATLVAALAVGAWVIWPFRRRPSNRQVARFVEERVPELEDRLASATDLGSDAPASGIQSLMLADAVRRVRGIDVERIVSRQHVIRAAWYGAAGAAALVVVLAVAVEPARRAVGAAWLYVFPETVHIDVTPGDVRVIAGQPLRVRARVTGVASASGRTRPVLEFSVGSDWRDVDMQPVDDGFQFEFASVTEDFLYRVTAASARSDEYTVLALTEPGVTRIDVEYDYPAFTGLERRVELDGGDIYAPAGTRVTLVVHADKPVEAGAMVHSDGSRLDLTSRGDEIVSGEFEVIRDGSYRIALSDTDGLSTSGDMEYFIRAIDDRSPDVRVLRPAGDRSVTPLEEVTIEARADDDYGLERFELVYAVHGASEQAIPFRGADSATTIVGTHTLYIEDMDVQPGDFVTYYARARDVNRGTASVEARSDIFFLDVTPFEEEFVQAQSQSQAGGGGGGLDELAAAQKEIIIATWKLDRRSAGGTSDEDVRTVAQAQGELKARTAEAAGGRDRPGSRAARPGVPDPAASDDPLTLAVAAMGDAQRELEAIETTDALPHEMEALNQLLKAEAEIRRRQVSQQRARAGGGSGRSNVDLSALFDRELLRDQQTNYETRASAQQEEETPTSAALQRVRELARRQDDLSRRQRELDRRRAEISPDELQRQLERLTREQSELRREAEELARQLDQQRQAEAGQPSQGGETTPDGGQRMRDVSEAMRGATSALRREDLERAGASGQQALDQLRELERQLRAADPEERPRAIGELQLEAQEVADAQRRLAAEAQHLDASTTSADGRQERADDKERLADRLEDLEDLVRELTRGAEDDSRAPLESAARQIDEERLVERMRESADAMREAFSEGADTDPEAELASLIERENELTDALDRVAQQIGRAGSSENADARRLSEQLAEARDLRERLRALERQLDALAESGDASGQSQDPQAAPGELGGRAAQAGDLARLRQEYDQELRRAQELFNQLRRENPSLERSLAAQAGYRDTRSAPGTEAFKQDYGRWDELRRDVGLALERFEASRSQQLAAEEARDRLNAGADDRVPEVYRTLVERYYRSLATTRPPR